MTYYEINEDQARQARRMWSMTDYVDGSTTADYKSAVDAAYKLANACPDHVREMALYTADRYAKKYADYINKANRVELMCPSVLISGPANFPTKKKEQQNDARRRCQEDFQKLQYYLDKLKRLQDDPVPTEPPQANITEDCGNYTVVHNYEEDRLQIIFTDKPNEHTRKLLKLNSFKWSPRFGAWQRQLTKNALSVMDGLHKLLGGDIYG